MGLLLFTELLLRDFDSPFFVFFDLKLLSVTLTDFLEEDLFLSYFETDLLDFLDFIEISLLLLLLEADLFGFD